MRLVSNDSRVHDTSTMSAPRMCMCVYLRVFDKQRKQYLTNTFQLVIASLVRYPARGTVTPDY